MGHHNHWRNEIWVVGESRRKHFPRTPGFVVLVISQDPSRDGFGDPTGPPARPGWVFKHSEHLKWHIERLDH